MNNRRSIQRGLALLMLGVASLTAQPEVPQVSIEEIQSKVGLTDEQANELQKVQQNATEKAEQLSEEIEMAKSKSERIKLMAQIKEISEDADAQIKDILTEEQYATYKANKESKRTDERKEALAITKERLELNEDQGVAFDAIMTVYQPQLMKLTQELKESSMFKKRKIAKELKSLNAEMDESIEDILTQQQFMTWLEIKDERRAALKRQM
ncbi:MAG: hypothetical protein ACPGN3_06290 [Opitutales bacterium]